MNAKKLKNPYFEQFAAARKHTDAWQWDFQHSYNHKYSWAVPTPRALNEIAKFAPEGIIELGAGTGYWASLLREMGLDVLAFDASPVQLNRNRHHWNAKPHTAIRRGYAPEAGRHSDRVLMLCWPPQRHRPLSHRALAHYTGNKLIYIGQPAGGLTATVRFHEMIARDWELVFKLRLPFWKGIENNMYFYRRKN